MLNQRGGDQGRLGISSRSAGAVLRVAMRDPYTCAMLLSRVGEGGAGRGGAFGRVGRTSLLDYANTA